MAKKQKKATKKKSTKKSRKKPKKRSKKAPKKKNRKKAAKKTKKKKTDNLEAELRQVLEKENQILAEEKKLEIRGERLEQLEKTEIRHEKKVEAIEHSEMDELKKLEKLEKDLKKSSLHPLTRVTYRDVIKGFIGAFAGIVGHFAFVYGTKISHDLSMTKAHFLFILSLAMVIIFIYFSGFRRVKEIRHTKFLPLRAIVIYITALVTIVFVLWIYGFVDSLGTFQDIYKSVAAISILAMLGAGAADLIGRE